MKPVHFSAYPDSVKITQGGVTIEVPRRLLAALILEAAKVLRG